METLQDLPDLILTIIFTLVEATRARNAMALVCRKWLAHRLASPHPSPIDLILIHTTTTTTHLTSSPIDSHRPSHPSSLSPSTPEPSPPQQPCPSFPSTPPPEARACMKEMVEGFEGDWFTAPDEDRRSDLKIVAFLRRKKNC